MISGGGREVADAAGHQRCDNKGDREDRIEHDRHAENHRFVDVEQARSNRQLGDLFHLFAFGGDHYRDQQANRQPRSADAHINIPERHGDDIRHLFALLKGAHIDGDRSQQQRFADRFDHLVAVDADNPEQLRDKHQQQDPRQALHHAFQRLLHHLIDRVI